MCVISCVGLLIRLRGKNLRANAGDAGLNPGLGRSPGGGNGTSLQYFLSGGSHGQWSLAGCSPWGCEESDTAEQPHEHLLSCTWLLMTRLKQAFLTTRLFYSTSPIHSASQPPKQPFHPTLCPHSQPAALLLGFPCGSAVKNLPTMQETQEMPVGI